MENNIKIERKYKAIDSDCNWVYGTLCEIGNAIFIFDGYKLISCNPNTLCMLITHNWDGDALYEGDVINFKNSEYILAYDSDTAKFSASIRIGNAIKFTHIPSHAFSSLVTIRNIHDVSDDDKSRMYYSKQPASQLRKMIKRWSKQQDYAKSLKEFDED